MLPAAIIKITARDTAEQTEIHAVYPFPSNAMHTDPL